MLIPSKLGLFVLVAALTGLPVLSEARPVAGQRTSRPRYQAGSALDLPYITFRVHRVGNLGLNISNTGYLGDRRDACISTPVPSLEFPINSHVEYNYAGGLWVGAVVDGDTLVSLAITGGSGVGAEFFPYPYPRGDILERTNRPILRQLLAGVNFECVAKGGD